MNNWARMLQEKGDYKGAEQSYQQAITIFRKEKGPSSWGLAKMLANLGLLRADEGNYGGGGTTGTSSHGNAPEAWRK